LKGIHKISLLDYIIVVLSDIFESVSSVMLHRAYD